MVVEYEESINESNEFNEFRTRRNYRTQEESRIREGIVDVESGCLRNWHEHGGVGGGVNGKDKTRASLPFVRVAMQ